MDWSYWSANYPQIYNWLIWLWAWLPTILGSLGGVWVTGAIGLMSVQRLRLGHIRPAALLTYAFWPVVLGWGIFWGVLTGERNPLLGPPKDDNLLMDKSPKDYMPDDKDK